MEPLEVIDLSSDDEKSPPKKQNNGASVSANKIEEAELEIVYNVKKKQKRSLDTANKSCSKAKRIKLSKDEDQSKIVKNLLHKKSEISVHKIPRIKPQTISSQCTAELFTTKSTTGSDGGSSSCLKTNGNANNLVENNLHFGDKLMGSPNSQNNTQTFRINEGASSSIQIIEPQLMVRKRVRVSETMDSILGPSTEVVESFLEACKSQDPSRDMERIISKLRKRYKNLQPSYAKSGSFIELIRNKKNLVLNNRTKLYLHISEVMAEMKARQLQKRSSAQDKEKFNTKEEKSSPQPQLSDIPEGYSELDQDVTVIKDSKNSKDSLKLQALEKAMRRCERYINKCEMAEVNFDDENDSHYIMAEKYKTRMVELFNKYCEITGEKPDAERPYLRPKNLSVTPISSLNHAITSFVNMKITKMNGRLVHMKKNGGQHRFTDALIFPDFVDILNCIKKCNEEENLQLNKSKQESIAKDAFDKLGKYLKRCRQHDYYDTFSLYLEKEDSDDPALSDEILAEKLRENQEIGKKKMDQVFQDFVEKEDAVASAQNGSCSDKEENAETGDGSSEESNDEHSTVSEIDNTDIGFDSDNDKGQNNDVNIQPQDDLNQKQEGDIDAKEPQENLEQKGNEIVELSKPQVDLNTKGDDSIEVDKPQADSNQNGNEDLKLQKHMDTNQETSKNPELNDSPMSVSVEKIDENRIEVDTSVPVSNIVIDEVVITKEKETEIVPKQDLVQQTEITCDIRQISIDQETNEANNIVKPVSSSSPVAEPAATVATCKVKLMQAAELPEMNLNDDCLPVVPENTTKVIDTSAVATTVELINEEEETKKPILRVRQFAKPPGSWKDFQSPPKKLNESNPQTGEASPAGTEIRKLNLTSPDEHKEPRKFIRLNQPMTIGKTVQLNNNVFWNLKTKPSTVIIPGNSNRRPPQINVSSVTNNVTFNINNRSQLQPKVSSSVSQGLKLAPKNFVNIDESGKIIAHCSNVRIINRNPGKKTSNPTQTVQTNKQQQSSIPRPTSQVQSSGQQTPGIGPRPQYIQGTTVRDISLPIMNDNGKRTVVRLVKWSPGVEVKNINVLAEMAGDTAAVQNRTMNTPDRITNCNSSTDAEPRLKPKLSNSIKNVMPLKMSRPPPDKVDKVYEAPADSVPTYVIE